MGVFIDVFSSLEAFGDVCSAVSRLKLDRGDDSMPGVLRIEEVLVLTGLLYDMIMGVAVEAFD